MTKMIDKSFAAFYTCLLLISLSATSCSGHRHTYNVKIFKSGEGWGYDISTGKKVYIHQPFMPVIEGQVPFPDKQSALKTGNLVVRKLEDYKSPSITREELNSIMKSIMKE